ncbi:MAG TPA: hypothetical protein VGJ05_15170 [Fimbriiglobus sp.]|jgi:hypothetical protein
MSRRLLLLAAAAAFLGWIGWLAYAVYKAGTVPIVSRAQLTAATNLLVVDLTLNGDQPAAKTKVLEILSGDGVKVGDEIEIENLPGALIPGDKPLPGPGAYLVPVVKVGEKRFRVAGLPRSPGYDAAVPGTPNIYPWVDNVKIQLRTLGLLK